MQIGINAKATFKGLANIKANNSFININKAKKLGFIPNIKYNI